MRSSTLLGLVLTACLPTENKVQAEIDDAAFCDVPEDCVSVGSQCPFGCNILVNESEAERIDGLLDRYNRSHPVSCVYDCAAMLDVACEQNQCVGVY